MYMFSFNTAPHPVFRCTSSRWTVMHKHSWLGIMVHEYREIELEFIMVVLAYRNYSKIGFWDSHHFGAI